MRIIMRIKEIRKNRNITLVMLAEKSGVSKTHISDIENNNKVPSMIVAIKIATALNVSFADLYKIEI